MTDKKEIFSRNYGKRELSEKTVKGGTFTLVSQLAVFLIKLGSISILARLILPEHFGMVAIVVAIIGFGQLFKDAGLSLATVQSDTITQEQVSLLFWINCTLGLCIALISAGFSPVIAHFYNEPRLTSIGLMLSLNFFFGGLTIQHQALLKRQMHFGRLGAVNVSATVLSVMTALIIISFRRDYWAIIGMSVSLSFFTAVGCWTALRWIPSLPRRGVGAKRFITFGLDMTLFNMVVYICQNIDKVLLGKFFSVVSLGLYSKAYQLVFQTIDQIRIPIFSVALSGLSSLQDSPDKFRDYYIIFLKDIVSIVIFPIALVMIFAEEIIHIFLGPNWLDASIFFRLFAAAALLFVSMTTADQVLVALGRTKRMLKLGLINSSILTIAISIGAVFGGPKIVATTLLGTFLVIMIPMVLYCLHNTRIMLKDFIVSIIPPFASCALISVALWLLKATNFFSTDRMENCLIVAGLFLLSSFLYYYLFVKIIHHINIFTFISDKIKRV